MPAKKAPSTLFRGSARLRQWQKCYEEWLIASQERSGSRQTWHSYRSESALFFTDPNKAPDAYTREEVAAFIRRQSRHAGGKFGPPAACTQNRRLVTLKSFYHFASNYLVPFRGEMRAILKYDPTTGMNTIKIGRKPKGLTEDELKRFFVAIPRETIKDKRDYALFSFYFWTARRRAEIIRLTWGDISETRFIDASGRERTGYIYQFSSKGHSRDVFKAELIPEAYEALLDYLIASNRLNTMRPETPLFIGTKYACGPIRPIDGTSANRILQKYAELAGLHANGRKITLHWLRHTRAQMQYREDPSEKCLTRIQRLLQHASMNTTLIYLQGALDEPDDGAARLATKLGKL